MKEAFYDDIPLKYIGGNILEIGVSEERLLKSKLGNKIKEGNYLGIDINAKDGENLSIIKADIIDYELKGNYDTILVIEVLEHIHFCYWKPVINKLKENLSANGYMIVSTPYNETLKKYIRSSYYEVTNKHLVHTVFSIDKKVMRYFFPGCEIKIVKSIWWRQDGAGLVWSILRFIKRYLFESSPIRKSIMVFWKKEGKRELEEV